MSANTKIEWADHTFNPWVGCTKVSPACDHCYAESWAKRAGTSAGVVWGGERRRTSEANWALPIKWNAKAQAEGRRYRVFCASLADVFDNQVPTQWRVELLATIGACEHLAWLLLTKRVGNVTQLLCEAAEFAHAHGMPAVAHWITAWVDGEPPSNVWLGATICNQAEADRDIPKLLDVPARVRFLSIEPMLSRIYIEDIPDPAGGECLKPFAGLRWIRASNGRCETVPLGSRIDWVICGGESGPGARPMHPDWARSLRDQCQAAGVPFLFKQWGEWAEQDDSNLPGVRTAREGDPEFHSQAAKCRAFMAHDGELVTDLDDFRDDVPYRGLVRPGKKAAGRLLDGVTHDGVPGGAA